MRMNAFDTTRIRRAVILVAGALAVANHASAQMAGDLLQPLSPEARAALTPDGTTLPFNRSLDFIRETIGTLDATGPPNLEDAEFYVLIHLVKWTTAGNAVAMASERWYVHRPTQWSARRFAATRVHGSRNVWLLQVHIDIPGGSVFATDYAVTVTEKVPINLQNLQALLQIVIPRGEALMATTSHRWHARKIRIDDLPADIAVEPRIVKIDKSLQAFGTAKVFDDEGSYNWDVGAAVPVVSVKELKFEDGAVVPKEVTRQTVYATTVWYPRGADLKEPGLRFTPSVFGGLGLREHPLRHGLIGAGLGPAVANFFVAATWQWLESDLQTATSEKIKWGGTVGIQVPLRSITSKLRQ